MVLSASDDNIQRPKKVTKLKYTDPNFQDTKGDLNMTQIRRGLGMDESQFEEVKKVILDELNDLELLGGELRTQAVQDKLSPVTKVIEDRWSECFDGKPEEWGQKAIHKLIQRINSNWKRKRHGLAEVADKNDEPRELSEPYTSFAESPHNNKRTALSPSMSTMSLKQHSRPRHPDQLRIVTHLDHNTMLGGSLLWQLSDAGRAEGGNAIDHLSHAKWMETLREDLDVEPTKYVIRFFPDGFSQQSSAACIKVKNDRNFQYCVQDAWDSGRSSADFYMGTPAQTSRRYPTIE